MQTHLTGTFSPAYAAKPAEVSSLACPSSIKGTISPASGAWQFGCALQSISPGWCKPSIVYHLHVWWMRWYKLVALVHYCWNQLISLLATTAGSLEKAPCALGHLFLLGGCGYPWAGTVSNQHSDHWDLAASAIWSCSCSARAWWMLQITSYKAQKLAPWWLIAQDLQAGDADPTATFQPELHICLVAGLQHQGICICEWIFFSAPDPTVCSAALVQLTWCLPQVWHFKLKLALAFKVCSNPFNSWAFCGKPRWEI